MDGGQNGFFNYIDADLRKTLYECMYHEPGDRPRVELLLAQARVGASRNYPGETEEVVRNWVNKYFHSAPTSTGDIFDSEDDIKNN